MKSLQIHVSLAFIRLKLLCQQVMRTFLGPSKVSSFEEWTRVDLEAPYHELWSSYRNFFSRRGHTLWKRVGFHSLVQLPPNENPRAPDGFSFETAYTAAHDPFWCTPNPKLHAARTRDNRDVIITLLGDSVSGRNAIEALERVGSGVIAAIDSNHTLPVLEWFHQGNLIFAVFPMVGSSSVTPWFGSIGVILEFMGQIIEGVAFLHDRRIAHRDLFVSNFLSSRRSGKLNPEGEEDILRSRYYITDFEWCICFPPDANPASCTVIGPPVDFEEYARPSPPEMRGKDPYCPFKADLWQLGCGFLQIFGHIEKFPEIIELLQKMRAADPGDRPTARDAVDRLNRLRLDVPSNVLQLHAPEADWPFGSDEDDFYNGQ